MTGGAILERILPKDAKYNYHVKVKHDSGGRAFTSYTYEDTPFDLEGLVPEERIAVEGYIPDSASGIVKKYTFFWEAPETGVYELQLPYGGVNQCMIAGVAISNNNTSNERPMGKAYLEKGWHEFTLMIESGHPSLTMIGAKDEYPVHPANSFRPVEFEEKKWATDSTGKPASFLLGAWATDAEMPSAPRATASFYGATPANDPEFPSAVKFNGDKSMMHLNEIRQTSHELTFAAWVKPESLEGTLSLFTRQKEKDNAYAQRGGVLLQAHGDQLGLVDFWAHPPKWASLEVGKWQHIAFVVNANKENLTRLYLNGEQVAEFQRGVVRFEVPAPTMELFGRFRRRLEAPGTSAYKTYE